MLHRSQQFGKEFKDFQNGNVEALGVILRSERGRLFDYIMRMTGQLAKSNDITEEVLASVESAGDDVEDIQQLYVSLYKTARNFASDVWNAETPKLENSAYSTISSKELGKDHQSFIAIEAVIRVMPPSQRETLLLRERYGFSIDEVAEITGLAHSDLEIHHSQAMVALEQSLPELTPKLSELLGRLAVFSSPKNDGPETQNLSLIMNDFRKTNRLGNSQGRWIKLFVCLLLILLLWYFREPIGIFLNAKVGAWLETPAPMATEGPTPAAE